MDSLSSNGRPHPRTVPIICCSRSDNARPCALNGSRTLPPVSLTHCRALGAPLSVLMIIYRQPILLHVTGDNPTYLSQLPVTERFIESMNPYSATVTDQGQLGLLCGRMAGLYNTRYSRTDDPRLLPGTTHMYTARSMVRGMLRHGSSSFVSLS